MQIIYLVAGGRAGSDFFQGFLDGHSQILQFPYLINNYKIFEIFKLYNAQKIAKKFIEIYPRFFNSKSNRRERHNRLGENKDKFYKVSKKKFIKNFVNLTKKKKLTKYCIIKYLHLAYSYSTKQKKSKKKIILMHTHIYAFTKVFMQFLNLKNASIIFTVRHPVASVNSSVKNWLRYQNGRHFFSRNLYFQLNIAAKGISDLINLKQKIFIVQLEKLHKENKKVMLDFCKIFKIRYEKSMRQCTIFGNKWWGDSVSGRWINGINKNFKITIDKNIFFDRDLKFLENISKETIKKYNYEFISVRQNILFNFLPMKSEFLVWKNTFKHLWQNKSKQKLKSLISIPFFYLKRIISINKFTTKIEYFPYSIGSNK